MPDDFLHFRPSSWCPVNGAPASSGASVISSFAWNVSADNLVYRRGGTLQRCCLFINILEVLNLSAFPRGWFRIFFLMAWPTIDLSGWKETEMTYVASRKRYVVSTISKPWKYIPFFLTVFSWHRERRHQNFILPVPSTLMSRHFRDVVYL